MSYGWTLSADADESILSQSRWYLEKVTDGEDLASKWSNRLQTALEKLSRNPHGFGFAPENRKWMPEFELRQMPFRPWKSGAGWRVLYTIDEKQKLVTVLQIRHERRPHLHDASYEEE